MYFQFKHLILWPRSQNPPRVINFKSGAVNIISGASKTGKSAVIPIIDYCLCANKCSIPVGVIREACEWFGVVVETAEGEKLFARREPGEKQQTGDMLILEAEKVVIPDRIDTKNSNADQGRKILDRLAGLSALGMNPYSEGYEGLRTGFRDLMAFTFQPQNVVANPDVLFYKADTTEHREKLKAIFPYILNAVTQQTLRDRWELDRLEKQLRFKEAQLKTVMDSVNAWRSEATTWVQTAVELGLLPSDFEVPREWSDVLDSLRRVASSNYRAARPDISSIEGVLNDLEQLQTLETNEAVRLTGYRQRLLEIKRLIESSNSYGDALSIQRDRLALSDWIRNRSQNSGEAISAISPAGQDHLAALCEALDGVEIQLRSRTTISDKLDKEQLRLRGLAEDSITALNDIRGRIADLERRSEGAKAELYRSDNIERYLGRLEQALLVYERSGHDEELASEVASLKEQTTTLRARIAEGQIRLKVQRALSEVEAIAGQIVPTLDAEWPDAAIRIQIKDLTLKIVRGAREDYLWEIGSGANWLAYHIATTLAFQRFFRGIAGHPVPSYLIYDQPSQVYFPQGPRAKDGEDPDWSNEDIVAVQKVFRAVSNETKNSNAYLQVIVLDHADDTVWGDVENVHLVEEWRGTRKLVPEDWIRL
ncbi:MAG: DUF3732 domain-containing protein [Hyphomonas sp.]|uniref:DUF3732 domain-containing protein n=1 Tax=Hyphomonas sp. TaxID=87 RepID=UPI003001AE04